MLSRSQSGLSVVKSCFFLHEADLARALLDSYGIEAWILDEHQIRQQWHLAGALGGIKVAVAPEDAYRARQVLAEDYSDVVEELAESEAAPGADPDADACPRCGGPARRCVQRSPLPGAREIASSLLWAAFGLLVPRRRFDVSHTCASCGHSWEQHETR
jgi:hypothetical protein